MIKRCTVALVLLAPIVAGAARAPSLPAASDANSIEVLLETLWQGRASFKQLRQLQIQTNGPAAGTVPGPTLMDSGTQVFAMSTIDRTSKTWYLFNRELFYAPAGSNGCPADISPARIVVRASQDQGETWSAETVIAEPNIGKGECELVDGHAFYDADTKSWQYICQMLSGQKPPATDAPQKWNINHYVTPAQNPASAFVPDTGNPVVRNGQLWRKICGAGKSCPVGTYDEGTPEISFKANGYYYVTFHGAYGAGPVWGYRGIAKTADFHTWLTHEDAPADPYLPDDALWSKQDCADWKVSWSKDTGCIGGGHASSLITASYTYMLIEAADLSLGCTPGQNWVVGLVRAPNLSAKRQAQHFVASGNWQQYRNNPLLDAHNQYACGIQYPRFFVDGRLVYLTYWSIGTIGSTSTGLPDNQTSFFHIARLSADSP